MCDLVKGFCDKRPGAVDQSDVHMTASASAAVVRHPHLANECDSILHVIRLSRCT